MTKSADLQRLVSLSDCVFAVAMTLLAFSVRIPDPGLDKAQEKKATLQSDEDKNVSEK